MLLHYRVKFLEGFKDGNIFNEAIPAGKILILSENECTRVANSGAVIERLETLVKNPLKKDVEETEDILNKEQVVQPVAGQEPEAEKFHAKYERWAEEDGEAKNEKTVLAKRPVGRPRKVK